MTVKAKSDSKTEGLTVYADPSSGYLYIKIVAAENSNAQLVVMNSDGKEVLSKSVSVNQLTHISLAGVVPGIYIATVITDGKVMKEKFRI